MKPPLHTCPTCKGSGQDPIPAEYAATLKRFKKDGPTTSFDLQEDGVSFVAICNRLTKLERMGFVVRVGKASKTILWKKTTPTLQARKKKL